MAEQDRAMKLISGGQSGVDRAVLDVAEGRYRLWRLVSQGRLGRGFSGPPGVLMRYPNLKETPLADPAQRTEWNVRDADACMICSTPAAWMSPRARCARANLAHRYRKPLLVVNLRESDGLKNAALWLRHAMRRHGAGLNLPRHRRPPPERGAGI